MKISDSKKVHEMYANYWIAMATTGACTDRNRNVKDGHGRILTNEELVKDALNTAAQHIRMFIEAAEHEQEQEQ